MDSNQGHVNRISAHFSTGLEQPTGAAMLIRPACENVGKIQEKE